MAVRTVLQLENPNCAKWRRFISPFRSLPVWVLLLLTWPKAMTEGSTSGGYPAGEAAGKHSLNQKDFKSATTQAAPVTRKVSTHSDQLKCAFG
jgi:hypothetical protein